MARTDSKNRKSADHRKSS